MVAVEDCDEKLGADVVGAVLEGPPLACSFAVSFVGCENIDVVAPLDEPKAKLGADAEDGAEVAAVEMAGFEAGLLLAAEEVCPPAGEPNEKLENGLAA